MAATHRPLAAKWHPRSPLSSSFFCDQGCRQYCCNHHYHFLSVTVLLLMWRTNWWICYASVADLTVSGAEQPSLPRLCFRSLKFSKYALCTYWVSGTVPGTGDGWTGRGPHHQGAHGNQFFPGDYLSNYSLAITLNVIGFEKLQKWYSNSNNTEVYKIKKKQNFLLSGMCILQTS